MKAEQRKADRSECLEAVFPWLIRITVLDLYLETYDFDFRVCQKTVLDRNRGASPKTQSIKTISRENANSDIVLEY